MSICRLLITSRYLVFTASVLSTIALAAAIVAWPSMWPYLVPLIAVTSVLVLIGTRDVTQTRHSILRNYPILGHVRFLLEEIRPELRQYLFEGEKDGMPFSRDTRAIVYQRAKRQLDKRPFGTQHDVYSETFEWVNHSIAARQPSREPFRITIGGAETQRRYSASLLNISAMSFGALSANAIRALNKGAKIGGFAHDTGEGGFSHYHREHGGDIIWEIGSGYFGCRNKDGTFNAEVFAEVAAHEQIKMVELKISQGAKPGHGGVLPAAKVSREIADIRGVERGQDCLSPPSHSAFSTPIELMLFIDKMRQAFGR